MAAVLRSVFMSLKGFGLMLAARAYACRSEVCDAHGATRKRIDSYLGVTKTKRCWEARGLPNVEQEIIALDWFMDENQDNEKGAAGADCA